MKKVIVITGQTATGKTAHALELAKKYDGELINVDSRQIYKYLDIITGKDILPNSHFEERSNEKSLKDYSIGYCLLENTKLWLYDIVDPKQPFSSYEYVLCARNVIDDIIQRGKIPIIIGGTYLYMKHLLYGIATENIPPDWDLRKELEHKSVEELSDILRSINMQLFEQLNESDSKNPRRLMRKIEIAHNIKSHSELVSESNKMPKLVRHDIIAQEFIGFRFKTTDDLSKIVKIRVEKRLAQGAVEEVENLLKRGYSAKDPGLQTIGYQEIIRFMNGQVDKETAIEQWIISELQYAKRQLTFMKKDGAIKWRFASV